MKAIRTLLLCVAACLVSTAPAAAKTYQLPDRGWVLGDLNGDRIADMASAGPGRVDGQGYAREVSISLSGFANSQFTVRSLSASIRLSVRDIDGDHDRDLVILEPWSLRPIGVWLNDGNGHFEEGDLSKYSAALGEHSPRSFASVTPLADSSLVLHEQRFSSGVCERSSLTLGLPSVLVFREDGARRASRCVAFASPRGPPSLL